METENEKVLALCADRHIYPAHVTMSVFPKLIDNIYDFKAMEQTCFETIGKPDKLILYASGCMSALITVLNYCHKNMIPVTVMHWDNITHDYLPQEAI